MMYVFKLRLLKFKKLAILLGFSLYFCSLSVVGSSASESSVFSDPNLFLSFLEHQNDPFDEVKFKAYQDILLRDRASLMQSPAGKQLIAKAAKAKKVLRLKAQMDKCFGGDIFELGSGRALFKEAMKLNSVEDCDELKASPLGSLAQLESEIVEKFDSQKKIDLEQVSGFTEKLFQDTALKGVSAEARLGYLISDPDTGGTLLNYMCEGQGTNCPEGFKQQAEKLTRSTVIQLKEKGYKPKSSANVAQELDSKVENMYYSLYSDSNPYHVKQTNPGYWERVQQNSGKSFKGVIRTPSFDRRTTFRPSPVQARQESIRQLMSKDPKAAQQKIKSALEKEKQILVDQIPEAYFNSQQELSANPYAQVLTTKKSWAEAFGVGVEPRASTISTPSKGVGVYLGIVSTNFGSEQPIQVSDQLDLVTPKSVRENKKDTIENLKSTIGDMGRSLYGDELDRDDYMENLKKLFLANPADAAKRFMKDPKLGSLYCQVFKKIQKDKNIEKLVGWSLMGVTIALAAATGGASLLGASAVASVSGATLAATAVVDTVYSASKAIEYNELGSFQRSSCFTQGAQSAACRTYRQDIDKSTKYFLAAGVGGALGASAFLKTVSKAVKYSTQKLSNISLRSKRITEVIKSDENVARFFSYLDEEASGSFYAHLAMLPEKEMDNVITAISKMSADDAYNISRSIQTNSNFEEVLAKIQNTPPAPKGSPITDGSGINPKSNPEQYSMENYWRLQQSNPTQARALDQAIEQTMSGQSYKVIKQLGDDQGPLLVEFENGIRAVMKKKEVSDVGGIAMPVEINPAIERAALVVDRKINLNNVPPTVLREVDGEVRSFQFFVDGLEEGRGSAEKLRMFDYLMGNTDRVKGGGIKETNIVSLNGRNVAIDNAYSLQSRNSFRQEVIMLDDFRVSSALDNVKAAQQQLQKTQSSPIKNPIAIAKAEKNLSLAQARYEAIQGNFLANAKGYMWPKEVYEGFKTISRDEWAEALRPSLGDGQELRNFLNHRDDMIQHIEGLRSRYGEAIFP